MNPGTIDSGVKYITTNLKLDADASQKRSYSGSGTAWNDVSGNANNGTLTNGPTYNSGDGGYFSLDGTDDSVNFGNSSTLNSTTSVTLELWIKLASDFPKGNFDTLIGKNSGSIANYIINANKGDGVLSHVYTPNNTPDTFRIINVNLTSYTLNVWCNMTTVFKITSGNTDTDVFIYLNGSLLKSQLNNVGTLSTNTANLNIGVGSFSIAIARVYTTALTDTQVLQNYNAIKSRFGL